MPRAIVQVAYAVADVRQAALKWASDVGTGPFFILDHIRVADVWHRGEPAVFDHSSAYGQWGNVMVELLQQHEVWPESLADSLRSGALGIHHVTWFAESLSDETSRLSEAGWPEVLTALTAGGLRFSFIDARPELGHLIELYEPTDRVVAFYRMVSEAADGWDGRDPVRTL